MGEIKSTLDLVMERTRHLSMSAEEKAHQHEEDFSRRIQGLLQQFADGTLPMEKLRERIDGLKSELGVTDPELLLKAVLGRIDPDGDNRPWLDLLSELAPPTRQPMETILGEYREAQAALTGQARDRQVEGLSRDHGIHGSAVIPNPDRDTAFRERREGLRRQTRRRIDALGA